MKKFLLLIIFLLLGASPLGSTFGDNDTDYQWNRVDNVINPFELFQEAFLWIVANLWVVLLPLLTGGSIYFLIKKFSK